MSGGGGNKGYTYCKNLRINSADRINVDNTTDTDFQVDLGNALQQVKRLSILRVQVPNVFYNVFETKSKYNNAFYLQTIDAGVPKDVLVQLPVGHYDAYSLMQAISNAVSDPTSGNANITLHWTLNNITGKTTVSATFAGTATEVDIIYPIPAIPLATLTGRQDYNPFGLLGFNLTNQTIALTAGVSVTGNNLPSLNQPSVCYVRSTWMSPSNEYDEKGTITNNMTEVSLAGAQWGETAEFDCKQDILCEIAYGPARQFSMVDVQLVDHDGDILDTQGLPINLYLKVWQNTF